MDPLEPLYLQHVRDLTRRYADALTKAGASAVLLHAGAAKKRSEFDDQYFPLRPTPHFHHWIPLNEAHAAVLVEPGRRPRLFRPRVTSFWERPAPLEAPWMLSAFDVVDIDEERFPLDMLPTRARLGFIGECRDVAAAWGIPPENVNDPRLAGPLDALRVHKSAYEARCLAEANRRAAAGHEAVVCRFRAGDASELDLHLAYLGATSQDDQETPYKNIVATGANASVLHHVSYGRRRSDAGTESLLLDAGATFHGYCSDITRTWIKDDGRGAAASAFAGLIAGVEAMQLRLCDAVKIGTGYETLHDDCHRQLGVVLHDIGLVRVSPDEAVGRGITRAFLPHGLGHSLGLQCHDVGCALVKPRAENPYLRNTSTIEEHQAFTIEPGVYFIDAILAKLRAEHEASVDWDLVDALAPLGGVRIEDDLVVAADGSPVDNLTRAYLPLGGGQV